MTTSTHTVTKTIHGVEFEITYHYSKGMRGATDGRGGPPIGPDDYGEIEVICVTSEEDLMDLLGASTLSAIQEAVEENHSEVMEAEAEDYADYLHDCARDAELDRRMEEGN